MAQDGVNIQVRVPDELYEKIDEWRRKQPAIPTMAATVRYFIEAGVAAEVQRKKGKA